MATWFGLPSAPRAAVQALAERFGAAAVCLTRGAEGAALWHEGRWTEHSGYRVEVADTVGAGDAFLAGLLSGYLAGRDAAATLERACRLGAYVATQVGSTPRYEGFEALPVPARSGGAKHDGGAETAPSTCSSQAGAS